MLRSHMRCDAVQAFGASLLHEALLPMADGSQGLYNRPEGGI